MAPGFQIGVPLLFALAALASAGRLWLLRRRVSRAWTEIEAQLARRGELVERLIEREGWAAAPGPVLLDTVVAARRQVREARGLPARAQAENELSEALRGLCRTAPAGDALRNSAGLPEWTADFRAAEERIAAARRAYNQRVVAWNVRIARLPWSLFSRPAGLQPIGYFALDDPVP